MNNLQSYLDNETIEYYKWLSQFGLFTYEQSIIASYFPKGSLVLDVGCGTGRTTLGLKSLGYRVHGIDYSDKMISKAIENLPSTAFSVQNVLALEFPDNSFDCALFSFNGLMLVGSYSDRLKAMSEIMRVVRRDGVFFFTTPFLDNKVNGEYWGEKIAKFGKQLSAFSEEELLLLGDEITDEGRISFQLHVPFISEIHKMIAESNCEIVFEGRRLNLFPEETAEDELDDNYIWVVKHGKV
ncbi:MAG: class I SAM-dependent methyltransferase [Oscillospiraceae bacterium]|nr:class I SAM-dependent methyltransferase [Oscillospiraceae bacterium]